MQEDPAKGLTRFQEDRRENWLSVEQLERLTRALSSYTNQGSRKRSVTTSVTGAREGRVLSATWDQFDLGREMDKASHHTKQKKIEHLPLSQAALDILAHEERAKSVSIPRKIRWAARYTAASVGASLPGGPAWQLNTAYPADDAANSSYRPAVRIHDLRHTYTSHLVSSGQSLHIVGKLLGHAGPNHEPYAHVADEALRSYK